MIGFLTLLIINLRVCVDAKKIPEILPRIREQVNEMFGRDREIHRLVVFYNEELTNKADIRYFGEILKATNIYNKENSSSKKVVFGLYDYKLTPKLVEEFKLYPQSLPKMILFKDNEKATQIVYKGGKGARQIFAWLNRQMREQGIAHYDFKELWQFGLSKRFILYYGANTHSLLYQYFLNEYWLKDTTYPIYHLKNFSMIQQAGCNPQNTSESDFLIALAKNSTYEICFTLVYNTIAKAKEMTSILIKEINEGRRGNITDFGDKGMEQMFKNQGKHYLYVYVGDSPSTQSYQMFQELCRTNLTDPCFSTSTNDNRTVRYLLGYLNHESTVDTIYFIDNEKLFPAKKYKLSPIKSKKSLLAFIKLSKSDKWARIWASQPQISRSSKTPANIYFGVASDYKQKIKEFKGDIVLMLVNSDAKGELQDISNFFSSAKEFLEIYGKMPVLFMIIDVFRNDLEEFEDIRGTPKFYLYDYLEKDRLEMEFYKDVKLNMKMLERRLPTFTDPEMRDL